LRLEQGFPPKALRGLPAVGGSLRRPSAGCMRHAPLSQLPTNRTHAGCGSGSAVLPKEEIPSHQPRCSEAPPLFAPRQTQRFGGKLNTQSRAATCSGTALLRTHTASRPASIPLFVRALLGAFRVRRSGLGASQPRHGSACSSPTLLRRHARPSTEHQAVRGGCQWIAGRPLRHGIGSSGM
jgi:hypothetical protein